MPRGAGWRRADYATLDARWPSRHAAGRVNFKGRDDVLRSAPVTQGDAMTDSERITELEVRLAYQEDILDALDQVVSRQGERIDLLERMNRELYARLTEILDDHKGAKPGDEPPPPHY